MAFSENDFDLERSPAGFEAFFKKLRILFVRNDLVGVAMHGEHRSYLSRHSGLFRASSRALWMS